MSLRFPLLIPIFWSAAFAQAPRAVTTIQNFDNLPRPPLQNDPLELVTAAVTAESAQALAFTLDRARTQLFRRESVSGRPSAQIKPDCEVGVGFDLAPLKRSRAHSKSDCELEKKKASVETQLDGGLALVGALSRRENSLFGGGYVRPTIALPATLGFVGANRPIFAVADNG
jgi:hypothetical protein